MPDGTRGERARSAPSRRRLLSDLAGLLLPVECAGCGAWDVALCPRCELLLHDRPRRCETLAGAVAGLPGSAASRALPTWCVAAYRGAVRGVVVSWKGRGGPGLRRAVGHAGRLAGGRWWDELEGAGVLPGAGLRGGAELVVVPAPSGWRRRVRGRLVVRALAREVASGLQRAASERVGSCARLEVADVLRRGRGSAHQSGLGVAARARNRRRSMRLAKPLPPASRCLLVDDVLTTGSTLAECRRVLESAGHVVLGALVLAATPASQSRPSAPVWDAAQHSALG